MMEDWPALESVNFALFEAVQVPFGVSGKMKSSSDSERGDETGGFRAGASHGDSYFQRWSTWA